MKKLMKVTGAALRGAAYLATVIAWGVGVWELGLYLVLAIPLSWFLGVSLLSAAARR